MLPSLRLEQLLRDGLVRIATSKKLRAAKPTSGIMVGWRFGRLLSMTPTVPKIPGADAVLALFRAMAVVSRYRNPLRLHVSRRAPKHFESNSPSAALPAPKTNAIPASSAGAERMLTTCEGPRGAANSQL
jgi:hypothetical protein